MKHLLSGVVAAALAVVFAPGWTQVSAANQVAAASMSDASTTSAMPPKHRSVRVHHHSAGGVKMGSRSGGNTMADQLNQQELSRLQSGGSMPAPEPASAPARGTQLQGPRPSGGR
jgi:hypothetical protein